MRVNIGSKGAGRPAIGCGCCFAYSCQPPPAKYVGRHTVTLITGDGIGPELLNHVRDLFRFCCVPVDSEIVKVDSVASLEEDINNAVTAIKRNGVALKGPTRHKDIDVMIIRENTEGEYISLEHKNFPGVVESLKIITRANSLRIAEYAFKLAREKGRHKEAYGFPNITFDNIIVDNTTMQASCICQDDSKGSSENSGRGTTSEVLHSIMQEIQRGGPRTSDQI